METVTYANKSSDATAKGFVVNASSGKVTVPKGTKKGKYQVAIAVTAAGKGSYVSGTATARYVVQVK